MELKIKLEEKDLLVQVQTDKGVLIQGAPGSGKTASIINPAIYQFVKQNSSMTIYDYFGDQALVAYNAWLESSEQQNPKKTTFEFLSLDHLHCSTRVNPLSPSTLSNDLSTRTITQTLLLSLKKEWRNNKDFYAECAMNLLYAIAERLRREPKYHKYCTIPHLVVLSTMGSNDVIEWVKKDTLLSYVISPFLQAIKDNNYFELSKMCSALHSPMQELMQKELFWIFGAEEEYQTSLDINNSISPKVFVLGNSPRKGIFLTPLLSSCVTSIQNFIMQKDKHPHVLVIDELQSLYINDFATFPSNAAKNNVSYIFGIQDELQLRGICGEETDFFIGNIGNSFIGYTNNPKTAEKYAGFLSMYIYPEKIIAEDIMNQPIGHFVGRICGDDHKGIFFSNQMEEFDKEKVFPNWKSKIELPYKIPSLEQLSKEDPQKASSEFNKLVDENYARIFSECEELIKNA